jgi:signal transduction histidine kinase
MIMLITLFCIPSYFALTSAIFEEKDKNVGEMLKWVDIYKRNIIKKDSLYIPKSVRFKINIYNEKNELLFGNIKNNLDLINFKIYSKYPNVYYQDEIKVGAEPFYIIVESKLNYNKIIFISMMLFLVIPFIIFLMSNMFIGVNVYSYKKIQQYMDDFFNDTMHELKTPLGVIKINLEMMEQTSKNSKYIKRIKSSLKQIQMAYEDIEYYIKHKRDSYQKDVINFSEFLDARIAFFEDIASSKSIIIESYLEPEISIYINETELQRIIDNNISNALKYSFSQKKIKVVLRRNKDGSGEFLVQDEGKGIKNIKSVFERFKRENTTEGGFGLGLNIVQNICKKNNISIDVKSVKDKGSTFTYIFSIHKT